MLFRRQTKQHLLAIIFLALLATTSCSSQKPAIDPKLAPYLDNPYVDGISSSSANYDLDQSSGNPLTPNVASRVDAYHKVLVQVLIGNITKKAANHDFGDHVPVYLEGTKDLQFPDMLFYSAEYTYEKNVVIRYHYHAKNNSLNADIYKSVNTFLASIRHKSKA